MPGDILLSPLALACVVVLVLNDHLLKHMFPGDITGKLSDLAGVAYAPILLAAIWELFRALTRHKPYSVRTDAGVVLCLAVGTLFAAMKMCPPVGDGYGVVIGWARAALTDDARPIHVAADPSDALVVPVVLLSCWLLTRRRATSCGE